MRREPPISSNTPEGYTSGVTFLTQPHLGPGHSFLEHPLEHLHAHRVPLVSIKTENYNFRCILPLSVCHASI